MTETNDGRYAVHWPLGRKQQKDMAVNARPGDLAGRRIGFIWDYMFRGDQMFPLLQAGLSEKFPGSSFVPYQTFGNAHGHDEVDMLATLPEKLKREQVDAVVVGVAA